MKPEVADRFTKKLIDTYGNCNTKKAQEISDHIVTALNNAALDVIPSKDKKFTKEIWKDDEIFNNLLSDRASVSKSTEEYKNITKLIKKRIRKLRNEKLSLEASNINKKANQREIEELYRNFKNNDLTFQTGTQKQKCDLSDLKKYFEGHFNVPLSEMEPDELLRAPNYITKLQEIKFEGIDTKAPTAEEIVKQIKSLKGGKSANDVPAEYLKHAIAHKCLIDDFVRLFADIWETKKVPKTWSHTKLKTIWKGSTKGKVTDPTAYRGIQIGATLCKLLVKIILTRINRWYEEQLADQQQGFRSGRGTAEGIYLLKKLQQVTRYRGKSCYVLFVDLSSAFDHVNRKWMFKTIMQRLSIHNDKTIFQLLKSIYEYTTTEMIENKDEVFEISVGVRQGGPESPSLFDLYIDYILRVFIHEAKRQGIKFTRLQYKIPSLATLPNEFGLGKCGYFDFSWIGYADDLVLAFDDLSSLGKGLELLNATLKRFGMKLNASKTKTMIFNHGGDSYPSTIVNLDSKSIDNVK